MSSHGHVTPNADGSKARCGGPTICTECQREAARLPAYTPAQGPLDRLGCCACPRVTLTMPAGAIVEVPACRVVALLAPARDQRAKGAECIAMLIDGSAIACTETAEALLKSGVGQAHVKTNDGAVAQLARAPGPGPALSGTQRPEVAGSSPAPAIETGLHHRGTEGTERGPHKVSVAMAPSGGGISLKGNAGTSTQPVARLGGDRAALMQYLKQRRGP